MSTHSPPSPSGLVRGLGAWTATAVVVGTVIGSGIFKKPQAVAFAIPYFGPAAVVWVLGGLLALLGALSLAEVAVLYPRAGGNYVFLREGYGRLFGFLWGWVDFWIIRSASIAALATICAEQLHTVLRVLVGKPPGEAVLDFWAEVGLTVSLIVVLALVNIRGVKWGGVLQLFITLVKVGSLLMILLAPFAVYAWLAGTGGMTAAPVHPEYLSPAWPPPGTSTWDLVAGFGAALIAVLWAYHGWMNIAPVAEEVKDPQKNIPRALLLGVGLVIGLYLGANLAYSLVIPQNDLWRMTDAPLTEPPRIPLAGSETPLDQQSGAAISNLDPTVAVGFSRQLFGPLGVAVAAAMVLTSAFGALNGNLLVGPRLLFAMGLDGLAPRPLQRLHPNWRTPVLATAVLAGWAVLLVVGVAAVLTVQSLLGWKLVKAGTSSFDALTDFAMFGAIIFETLAVATVFVFRWRRPDAERPYRCIGYPVVPGLYVGVMALVAVYYVVGDKLPIALVGLAFMAVGTAVYGVMWRLGRG
jgi:APA family basic amino acid/polyamine antiporter